MKKKVKLISVMIAVLILNVFMHVTASDRLIDKIPAEAEILADNGDIIIVSAIPEDTETLVDKIPAEAERLIDKIPAEAEILADNGDIIIVSTIPEYAQEDVTLDSSGEASIYVYVVKTYFGTKTSVPSYDVTIYSEATSNGCGYGGNINAYGVSSPYVLPDGRYCLDVYYKGSLSHILCLYE